MNDSYTNKICKFRSTINSKNLSDALKKWSFKMTTQIQKSANKYYLFNRTLASAIALLISTLMVSTNVFADGSANFDSLNSEEIPSVELTLPVSIDGRIQFEGQFVSLFFVEAKKSGLTTSADQIDIVRVKDVRTLPINANRASFGATRISIEGASLAYNYVVAVIHPQPRFFFKNANSSLVIDPRLNSADSPNPTEYIASKRLTLARKAFEKNNLNGLVRIGF